MSDYRDPNDPMYGYEPADRTGIWGWIAGAAGLVIARRSTRHALGFDASHFGGCDGDNAHLK
jgi:hypothetical protein